MTEERTVEALLTTIHDLREDLRNAELKWEEEALNHRTLRSELNNKYNEMEGKFKKVTKEYQKNTRLLEQLREAFKSAFGFYDQWDLEDYKD